MRLGTANIKNYPDMPPKKVAADAKTMSLLTDIWGQQENDPGEDNPVIMRTLGDTWAVAHPGTNVPVYFKKELYQVAGARVQLMPFTPRLPLTPVPRLMTGTTFVIRARPNIAPFVVINVHFIAGAYNGENTPNDTRRRRRQWDLEWTYLQRFVGDYRRKGLTVFVEGDFNHPRPPKPTANWQWLVGERLDRIGVARSLGTEVEELDDGSVELNSDHRGQWTRVILSNAPRA